MKRMEIRIIDNGKVEVIQIDSEDALALKVIGFASKHKISIDEATRILQHHRELIVNQLFAETLKAFADRLEDIVKPIERIKKHLLEGHLNTPDNEVY